jgi:putative RNA 2'-phosphotransferase
MKPSSAVKKPNREVDIILYIAFILRHKPHSAGIKLDDGGWVELSKLSNALLKFKKIKITDAELLEIINAKAKKSFVLSSNSEMIRAKGGHTVLFGFVATNEIPQTLYTSIDRKRMSSIFSVGLISKPGEYLIENVQDNKKGVTVSINTNKAVAAKVKFYRKESLFFAFYIPVSCLTFESL